MKECPNGDIKKDLEFCMVQFMEQEEERTKISNVKEEERKKA